MTSLAEWAFYAFDLQLTDWGNGNNFAAVCWTFKKTVCDICLCKGDDLQVTINDDLTDLVQHSFTIEGVYGWVQPDPTTGPSNMFK